MLTVLEPGILWGQNGNLGIKNLNPLKIRQFSLLSKYQHVAYLFSDWLTSFGLLNKQFLLSH